MRPSPPRQTNTEPRDSEGHSAPATSDHPPNTTDQPPANDENTLIADRRAKLQRLRDECGVDPFGHRVDGLICLAEARGRYDPAADQTAKEKTAEDPSGHDPRPAVKVAGRVMLHRAMGKLIFMTLRDATGDLQVAVSKKLVDDNAFKQAQWAELGDLVIAQGRLGTTKTGEITVWAAREDDHLGFELATKSLAPPPEKWHGLQDPQLRYRKRYVDLYANPGVMSVFATRSKLVQGVREFLTRPPTELGPGFVEVETPMMQPIPGGAAARPFVTHHNALGIKLFLRIAPELYLKRLLVGGMPRVFEINRNFRNEGVSPRHNPEFTMLELYQAFGDYRSMMDLTERLIHHLATTVIGQPVLPFEPHTIDYSLPFRRVGYHEAFQEHNGFDAADHGRLTTRATQLGLDPAGKDHDVLLQEVWEATVEKHLIQPTFIIDYPASLCPLTKPKQANPDVAERFELYIAGMEIANAYTELNDPDLQEANFKKQVAGLSEDEAMFRNMDGDFIEALRVGMPPAGGLGVGIDRLVMLLTNSRSIRDVILFPLMRPVSPISEGGPSGDGLPSTHGPSTLGELNRSNGSRPPHAASPSANE